jgi:hypothetical protein
MSANILCQFNNCVYLKGSAILTMFSTLKNGYKHTVYMLSSSQNFFFPREMYEPKVHYKL